MVLGQGATYKELLKAYYDCRKSKRTSNSALSFEIDFESSLFELREELNSGNYKPGPLEVFIVTKPVRREIFAASFRDRVVHHWLINHLNPYFEREFIYDSYACRKGKGTLLGIRRLERAIRRSSVNYQKDCWILKLDIQGFFMSIDKKVLWHRLKQFIDAFYIGSNQVLVKEISRKVIAAIPTKGCVFKSKSKDWQKLPKEKSLFYAKQHCGLPIGNLTSQIFANFYMNSFDHFVKAELGVKYYGRYVDDFYLVDSCKDRLLKHKKKIAAYLNNELYLNIHPRKEVLQHFSKGINFLGHFVLPGKRYAGKRLKGNFYRALQVQSQVVANKKPTKEEQLAFLCVVNSYFGFLKHTNSYRLRKKMILKHLSVWWRSLMVFSKGYTKASPRIRRVK
jgi:RNA-directed DNA polymerase